MAKAQGHISQIFPEYILRDKSRACKQRFQECFQIPDLGYDDWLEQRCAEFNWWTSGLNADKRGPGSLDARLKLRPDFMDIITTALDGLESSLSSYYEIGLAKIGSQLPNGKLPDISETMDHSMDSADVERSPSPWSDMSDSSHIYSSSAASDYDILYYEPRVYIMTNLEILIRIYTAIKRSGLKFMNQRADEILKQADESYQKQKAEFGERHALPGQNGDHERFRRYLTKLVLWNGYTQNLIQRMNFRITELVEAFKSENNYCSQSLLEEKKLLIIFRAYFQDPARLTTVQRRLINANVIRRNRLIYAGSVAKPSFQAKVENRKQPKPEDVVHRPSTVNRAKTVLTSSQRQPHSIASEEPTMGGQKTIESVVVPPATALDSRFTITGALAPPSVNKSAATKFSARVNNLDYPKCPVQHGQFPCPYCSTTLTDEYTKKDKWRGHVAHDLCAYICVFEDCQSPDDMFASTYEWMSHIAKFHSAIDWVCPVCAKHSASSIQDNSVLSFQSSALLKSHMVISHPALDPAELNLFVESGKRTIEIQRVRCPLCRAGLVTLENSNEDGINSMASLPFIGQAIGLIRLEEDEHIATHIHEFALQSLPYRQEATSECSEASFSQSRSQITSQDLKNLEATRYRQTPSTEQPPMYNLGDMKHMVDDLYDEIREFFYKQEPLGQSPISLRKSLSHEKSLLSNLLDDLSYGIAKIQRGFGNLGGEDVDSLAISLNECRVTVSQFGNLPVADTIEKPLRIQLLHNLNNSNEILQQAFSFTLTGSMGQGGDKSSVNETEYFQTKRAQKSLNQTDEGRTNRTEPEKVGLDVFHYEDASEKAEKGGAVIEEVKTEKAGTDYSEADFSETHSEVDSKVDSETEEDETVEVQHKKPGNEEIENEQTQIKNPQTEDGESDPKDLNPEHSEHIRISTSDKGKGPATTNTLISKESRFNMSQSSQEDMTGYITKAGISSFFPEHSNYTPMLADGTFNFQNDKENPLNRDAHIQGITKLNLYEAVLYCDDSTSMKYGTRLADQKNIARQITRVSTSMVPPGFGMRLQFINLARDIHDNKLNQQEIKAIMKSVRPAGHRMIGTNLKEKILKPLVYDVIKKNKRLERPILVFCFTCGCPNSEPPETFKKEILKCIQFLRANGYPPSTIRFHVSQIGSSSRVYKFLRRLSRDPELSEVVYCTSLRPGEKSKTLRDNEIMLERWLLRTLLEPIMGKNVNDLKLLHG